MSDLKSRIDAAANRMKAGVDRANKLGRKAGDKAGNKVMRAGDKLKQTGGRIKRKSS